jgi:hypothetical protein
MIVCLRYLTVEKAIKTRVHQSVNHIRPDNKHFLS